MMADSIESATRVLQEPTPERVRDLVDGIIESKRKDGQLDEAPLTMREITVLKDTFAKALSGIHHHRIDYPTTKHLTDAPDDTAAAESDSKSGQTTADETSSEDKAGSKRAASVSDSEQMELGDDQSEG
jgi:hypothetical protein